MSCLPTLRWGSWSERGRHSLRSRTRDPMGPLIRGNRGHCEGMKRAQTAIHLSLGHGVVSAALSPLLGRGVSLGDEGRWQSQMSVSGPRWIIRQWPVQRGGLEGHMHAGPLFLRHFPLHIWCHWIDGMVPEFMYGKTMFPLPVLSTERSSRQSGLVRRLGSPKPVSG